MAATCAVTFLYKHSSHAAITRWQKAHCPNELAEDTDNVNKFCLEIILIQSPTSLR